MIRVGALGSFVLLWIELSGAPLAAQDPESDLLRRHVDAYLQGRFDEAEVGLREALERELGDSAGRDPAIAHAYLGLVHAYRGEAAEAEARFEEALRRHFALELDPDRHAPSRIRTFETVRVRLAGGIEFVSLPGTLEPGESVRLELRFTGLPDVSPPEDGLRWESLDPTTAEVAPGGVLRAVGDAGGEAEVVAEWTPPGGEVRFEARTTLEVLAAVEPVAAVEPPPPSPPSPTSPAPRRVLVTGLVLPGAGQFSVGRRGRGLLTIAAAGGAIAVGILNEETEVLCASPELDGGSCPAGSVLEEGSSRPHLGLGLGAAAAVTVLSALDASRAIDERQQTSSSLRLEVAPGVRGPLVVARVWIPLRR